MTCELAREQLGISWLPCLSTSWRDSPQSLSGLFAPNEWSHSDDIASKITLESPCLVPVTPCLAGQT